MNIDNLREHLFDTLKGIKDGSMTVDQAKVMGEVGQVLINSAKVEVDYIRANNGGKSNFITLEVKQITQTATGTKTINGASTVHQLR
jgi:hypothetical protein